MSEQAIDADGEVAGTLDDGVPAPPGLPPGRMVELGDRGPSWLRADPDGAGRTDVLVIHGWTVTADTTFAASYPTLADDYRVIAPDLRGHGRGLRSHGRQRVRLESLADDMVDVLDAVGSEQAVVVGYSLGGAVAQLLWHRNPERVQGLVLCSTARNFQTGPVGDLWYRGQAWVAPAVRAWPGPARARMVQAVNGKITDGPYAEWFRRELLRSDPSALLHVGAALGRFRSNRWIGDVDVPTAVIMTTQDRTVPTRRQRGLAAAIPGARAYEVPGPHNAVVTMSDVWVPTFRRALDGLRLD